jgi:hypothetical protein
VLHRHFEADVRGLRLSIACATIGVAAAPAVARAGALLKPEPSGVRLVAQREKPRYYEPVARCATPYHAALADINARLGTRLANLAEYLTTPSRDLPGRWLVPDAPGRRAAGFDGDKFVDGNKQCANLVQRAGRIRCMKWEPLTYDPIVEAQRPIVPDPTEVELQTYQLLEPWVRSRGAGPEFRYEGRFVWATTKLAADFASYIGQPAHPALCSGARQVIEVFGRKARGLRERIAEVDATVATIRQQALTRLEHLRLVARQFREAERYASNAASKTTAADDPAASEPGDFSSWADTISGLAMTREQADDVRATSKPLDKLKHALNHLRPKQTTSVPKDVRAEAIATLRAAEAVFYADVMASRFHEIRDVMFGSIDGAQQAYTANCTCEN